MSDRFARSRTEGHPTGGPLFFAAWVAVASIVAGCGGGAARPGPDRPEPVMRPLAVYEELGLLAGSEEFPAVVSLGTLAGPADSTYVVLGLSLPARALRFLRDSDGFTAEYEVGLTFLRDGQRVLRVERREVVRVPTFAETTRTDESVVFQTLVAVPPGVYPVEVEVRDLQGTRTFTAEDTVRVPVYGAAATRVASPLFVYRANGRMSQRVLPDLVLNPRRTIPYGTEVAALYLEAYGVPAGQAVTVTVVDQDESVVWEEVVVLGQGTPEVRFAVVEIPAAALPLGRLWINVAGDGLTVATERSPLLVSLSEEWVVANFDEVLEFLAYIATPAELDSLRELTGAERQQAWERFWARRDPAPGTPVNEFRERFFERLRTASERFREPGGVPGWRTERGEVYIVLGPPDQVLERPGSGADLNVADAQEWIYEASPLGRLHLIFVDRNGFGRYELTSASRSAFRSAAARLRPSR